MSPNAPKETGGKIKVYTPPRQTALDLLWIQEISITSTSQKNHSGERAQIFLTEEFQQL